MNPKAAVDIKKVLESYRQVKPAKTTDLFILGMLANKDLSGYDIYKAISAKSNFTDSWFKLNKGTVYNTLARFNDEKFIEVVERQSTSRKRKLRAKLLKVTSSRKYRRTTNSTEPRIERMVSDVILVSR